MLNGIVGALLLFISIIMILLILIQRGRGGGLAGAFGGMGGQSALGVRAGDVFTKITVVMAVIWVLLAGLLGISMRSEAQSAKSGTELNLSEGSDEEESADELDGASADVAPDFSTDSDPAPVKAADPTDDAEPSSESPQAESEDEGTPDDEPQPSAESTDASESPVSETPASEADADTESTDESDEDSE